MSRYVYVPQPSGWNVWDLQLQHDIATLPTQPQAHQLVERFEAGDFRVGDPDPTSDHPANGQWCNREHVHPEAGSTVFCTWEPDHPGQPHVAGGYDDDGNHIVVAVWPREDES